MGIPNSIAVWMTKRHDSCLLFTDSRNTSSTSKFGRSLFRLKALVMSLSNLALIIQPALQIFANTLSGSDTPEELQERMIKASDAQEGSKFKNFKNLEILQRVEERVPEKAKEAIRNAQENALKRLQGDIYQMSPEDRSRFADYVENMSGDEVKHAIMLDKLNNEDLDWLGLHATRLNGHLIRTIFRDVAHPVMVTNPDDVIDIPKSAKLIIAAGYRPGASTDLRAVQIAGHIGAKRVINLSNIDYAYTKDPNKYKDAKKIKEIGWKDFRKLLPEKWDPGLSSPFDPVASREAERLQLEVAIINGKNLKEFENYLVNKPFKGTRIY